MSYHVYKKVIDKNGEKIENGTSTASEQWKWQVVQVEDNKRVHR